MVLDRGRPVVAPVARDALDRRSMQRAVDLYLGQLEDVDLTGTQRAPGATRSPAGSPRASRHRATPPATMTSQRAGAVKRTRYPALTWQQRTPFHPTDDEDRGLRLSFSISMNAPAKRFRRTPAVRP